MLVGAKLGTKMPEVYVAIEQRSRYAGGRGKFMAEGSTRPKGTESDTNGETKQKQSKTAEKRRAEKRDNDSRTKQLQKELKEARKSSKKTQEQAEEAKETRTKLSEEVRQAKKEKEHEENETEVIKKSIAGKDYLVWEKKKGEYDVYGLGQHFDADEIKGVLKELGIGGKLPRDWKKHENWEKRQWLEARGVRSLGEVVKMGEGLAYIDVPPDLTRNQVKTLIGIEPPKDWADFSNQKKRDWYFTEGKRVLPPIMGAGTEVPEWSDVMVANPRYTNTRPLAADNQPNIPNPEANIRQDLETVISRRLELQRRGLIVLTPGSDWLELSDRLNTLVADLSTTGDYMSLKIQTDEMEKIHRAFAAMNSLPEFDAVITPAQRTAMLDHLEEMNEAFQGMYELDPNIPQGMEHAAVFGDIDQLASDKLGSAKGGWVTEEEAIAELLRKAHEGRNLEPDWAQGIRDWYVFERSAPQVRDILEEYRDLTAITDPDEFEKAITRGLRKADSTNLSSSDLNSHYQRILGLVTEFPVKDIRGVEMRNQLSAEIQASLLMNQIFIVVENGEAHPEKLLPLFEQLKNIHATQGINSLQVFMRRFRLSYSDGSALEDDLKNPLYRNPATREAYDFNLGSDIINIIHHELQGERLVLNEIQDAQREGRAFNAAIFAAAGVPVPPPYGGPGSLYRVPLELWFKHNTFVAASGEVYVDPVTGAIPDPNMTYVDFHDRRMIDRIRDHLINARSMTPAQVDNMEVIIRANYLNALRFVQAFGWSEYDGIETEYANGRPNFTVFGPRTPFFARAVDNPFKHFRNENRGQIPRTNQVLEEEMPLGYMLPTVRVLVRFTENLFLLNPAASPPLNDVAGFNARWGLALPAGTTVRQAHDALVPIVRERFGYNFANASGVVVAEMIDRGNVTFGRQALNPADTANLINWEEELRDLRRFDFTDLFGDRLSALKMYDRGALQEFLRNPTYENWAKVYETEIFYSGRNVRLWDNVEKGLHAYHRIQQAAPEWFHRQERGSAFDTYSAIQAAAEGGKMDTEAVERTMRDLLGIWLIPGRLQIPGIGPVRWTRLWADFGYFIAKRNYNPAAIVGNLFSAIFQFFTEAFKQTAQQTGAAR